MLLTRTSFTLQIITSANYLLSDLYSPDDLHTLPALDSRACEEDECSRGKEYDLYDELDRASIQSLGSNKSEDETLKVVVYFAGIRVLEKVFDMIFCNA